MPVNACSADSNASFDHDICQPIGDDAAKSPAGEGDCSVAEPRASAVTDSGASFVRFDHAVTSGEDGQFDARAALLHGHDPQTGVDLEVLSVAARRGSRASVEIVAERVGLSTPDARSEIHADLLSAGAELGTRNADGSDGFGFGAGASAVAMEGTVRLGNASSVTLGTALGVGLHASAGTRDIDSDGKREVCGRLSVEFLTVAACVESPF